MDVAALMLSPEELADAATRWQPIGFVDLATISDLPATLPPFPVVGLGDRDHPAAAWLDAIVEPPVSAETVARNCVANPHAAAAAVQLLRLVEGLDVPRGLAAESLCYGLLQGSAEHRRWRDARPGRRALPPGRVRMARAGDVLDVVIDRAEARNAIDVGVRDGLAEAFLLASADGAIDTVRLRSTGPAFSIGGDLGEFGTTRDPATAHLIRARTLPARALAGCAERLDVHVQGACVGAGLEIAAFAARLTAQRSAWFQLPELAMGLVPGAGGCVSLPRRIGRQRAALMMLSGRRFRADVALRWGLVDALVDEPPVGDGGADEIG